MTTSVRAFFFAFVLLLPAASALAGPVPIGSRLIDAGWELWTKAGVPAARFERRDEGVIEVSADSGFALLYRKIAEDDAERRFLRWRWRVDLIMPATDLSRRGVDDRPLAVHVWFPDRDASFVRRITQGLVGSIIGVPFRGKVLTYVWGGIGRRGDQIPNPHLDADGVIVTLRAGDASTGLWQSEDVDLAADFERAFGYAPPPPSYLAISADSDDTRTRSVGAVAELTFSD